MAANTTPGSPSKVSVPDLVVDFHYRYSRAPRYIYWTEFNTIFPPWTHCFEIQQSWREDEYKETTLSYTSDILVVVHWSGPALIK